MFRRDGQEEEPEGLAMRKKGKKKKKENKA